MHISLCACVCVCVCVCMHLCLHMCVFVHVIYCFKYSQVIVGDSVCGCTIAVEDMCVVDKGGVCEVWQAI